MTMRLYGYLLLMSCFGGYSFVFSERKEYVAAIFEHRAFFIPFIRNVTRKEALKIMNINLEIYQEQARKAKARNAQIIVFPEDGLYGFSYTRDSIYPFLEPIPQPSTLKTPWIPCQEPQRFKGTEVLQRLSCIAMELSIAVVANMGDVQPCTHQDHHCPSDMRNQYNTDVVFDVDGKLLAKYHKKNLFHEKSFNEPPKCELITFTTGFGIRFGVFTCFDILFKCPSIDLITDYDIHDIVMPTAWMDGFPTLVSIQFQQAWSRVLSVNLLAANQNQPLASMYGSGIYSCGEPKVYLFDPWASKDQRLMVATLKTPSNCISKGDNYIEQSIGKKNFDNKTQMYSLEVKQQMFKCKIQNDIYDVVLIEKNKGLLSVCQNRLCCNLRYEITGKLKDRYVFGVFRGLHSPEHYFIEVCLLVKCMTRDNCGSEVETSSTIFNNFQLSGNFTSSALVFPEILVSGMELVTKDDMQVSNHSVMTVDKLQYPLVSAVLFGRDYSKDE